MLSSKYDVRSMGFPTKYLGWSITRFPYNGIGLSQTYLIHKLVQEMKMGDHTPTHTPYPQNHGMHPPNEDDVPAAITPTRFAEMV